MKIRIFRTALLTAVSTAAAALFSSCAAPTPASRVAGAPHLFERVPASQREAVLQGRVTEGMTPDAVYLALGSPDRVTRGSENGRPYELWRYTQLQPVYRSGISLGYGMGPYWHGGWGHGYYSPAWVGWETGPDYVPVTAVAVRFTRNRVTGWEKLR